MSSQKSNLNPNHDIDQHGYNGIPIPPTTDSKVIFPFDETRFRRDRYDPIQTDNKASLIYVNQILSQAEEVLRIKLRYWSFARKIMAISFPFLIYSCTSLLVAHFYFYCIFVLIAIFLLIWIWNRWESRQIQEARVIIQKTFDQENASLENVGIQWNLPYHFPAYIELHNDFRKQTGYVVAMVQPNPDVVAQPEHNNTYQPPQQHQMP